MITRRKGNVIEADIHGMTANDAYRELIRLLDHTDNNISEIHVIHGYRRGDTLKVMVQCKLNHAKISYKCESLLNEGETKIYLKKS